MGQVAGDPDHSGLERGTCDPVEADGILGATSVKAVPSIHQDQAASKRGKPPSPSKGIE
jgi:hypothetical protein